MINHFRTLLLNAKPGVGGYPGEELVPPDFVPVTLSGGLPTVRQLLFGQNPDRLMLNYRAQQLLAVVASTELQSFVTQLDPRLTYDVAETTAIYRHQFMLTGSRIAGDQVALYVGGEPGFLPDLTGRCQLRWRALVNGPSSVTVSSMTPPYDTAVYGYSSVDGLSTAVPLLGSGFHFQFQAGAGQLGWQEMTLEQWLTMTEEDWLALTIEGAGVFDTNPVFSFSADVRPTRDPAVLLAALDNLGEPVHLQLFGVGSTMPEPMATFYRLWKDHKEPAYRLGAAVCALVYRTEDLR